MNTNSNDIIQAFETTWPIARVIGITAPEQMALLIELKYTPMDYKNKNFEPYQGKEDDLQKSLMRYVRAAYPPERHLYCHIPNGGARTAKTGALMKSLGVRPGMPDLMFFDARPRPGMRSHRYTGLAIELKVGKNTRTATQSDVHSMLLDQGWCVHTTNSLDEAIFLIDEYFNA